MCGRFVSARERHELIKEFAVQRDQVTGDVAPDYNVAPTKRVYAVLARPERNGGHREGTRSGDGDGAPGGGTRGGDGGGSGGDLPVRKLRMVRWGLVPSWAKDPSAGARLINARAETVAVKPSFRNAFRRRRCLIPADGYYEWRPGGTAGRAAAGEAGAGKQPYYIHRADGGVLAFAGIYELWRDGAMAEDDPGAWLWTAAIVTTRATDDLGEIHDRMPMVIEPDRWADWLDPGLDGADGLAASMQPAASAGLAAYPVSTTVNSVRNNGPSLVAPLAAGRADGTTGQAPQRRLRDSGPLRTAGTAGEAPPAAHQAFGPVPGGSARPPGMLF